MGRRSINTTKSGKYMNPTDQARKEARKRELKKNKRQRTMVRAAVLKGKDPSQILLEMEKLDMIEYDVENKPTLSGKVLMEKRKKLKETLDRVTKMYEKENPEQWVEIRRMESEHEKKRQALIEYYEAVKHAQAVTVDEIPLPNLETPNYSLFDINTVPIPSSVMTPGHGILKKSYDPSRMKNLKPPGCPPICPPELLDFDEVSDDEDEEIERNRTVRFMDATDKDKDTRLTISKERKSMIDDDIDEFMREAENLFNEERQKAEKETEETETPEKIFPPGEAEETEQFTVPPPIIRPGLQPGPPIMPTGGIPIGMGLPPRLPLNIGMPPPMRLPHRMPIPPGMIPMPPHLRGPQYNSVLSAGPQLIRVKDVKSAATIEAKPQLRSLSAEITRFLPTALRVKREDKKKAQKQAEPKEMFMSKAEEQDNKKPTKDDAYSQFMQEMQGLL